MVKGSVLGAASSQVTKFLQVATIFLLAGDISSGVRLEPPSRPPTGARVLAKTKTLAICLAVKAPRGSHGLLADFLPEVGEVKFIQEDVGENDKVK